MTTTTLATRSASATTEFAPYMLEYAPDKSLLKGKEKAVHVVGDAEIKTPSTHVVAVTPAQLKLFGASYKHKDSVAAVAFLWKLGKLTDAMELVRGQGGYELFIRLAASPEFVTSTDAVAKDAGDRSRLRQLTDAQLVHMKKLYEAGTIGTRKSLAKGFDLIEGDEIDSKARIDFSQFPTLQKVSHIPSMSTLAPNRLDVKRGREEAQADVDKLTTTVKMTKLPNGKMAFSFVGVSNLFVAGDVVVGQTE